MNFPCKLLLLWSCLCYLLAMPALAQEAGQGQAALHQPSSAGPAPARKVLFNMAHARYPSVSCCNEADCYPTEIKYVDGELYAKRREDGKYIPIPPQKVERNRDNPDGRNHLCAPPPQCLPPIRYRLLLCIGGCHMKFVLVRRQNALPAILLCAVL